MNLLWPVGLRLSCRGPRASLRCSIVKNAVPAQTWTLRAYSRARPSSPRLQNDSSKTSPVLTASRLALGSKTFLRTYAARNIVTEFEKLPAKYDDEKGLAFRSSPLSTSEAASVFGPGVDAAKANRILEVLHGRRVAGTLEDPKYASSSTDVDRLLQTRALAWLRLHVPVDEIECAGQRALLELGQDEAKIIADSERLGIFKPAAGEVVQNWKNRKGPNSVYGESGLDAIRAQRERRLDEEEQARKSQAEEIKHTTGPLVPQQGVGAQVELRRPGENPKLKYYLERANVLPDVPPPMTAWQRLSPSLFFTLALVGVIWLAASVYVPPKTTSRLFPDIPPAAATVISLIVLNSAVFLAWRVPPLFRTLNKYFMTYPGYPRAASMLGSIFSHQAINHFATNMAVLWIIGVRLHDDVGRANFLAIYLTSGVVSSFASLAVFTMRGVFISSSLGASGAVCGTFAAYLWLHGSETFKIFGIFPPDPIPGVQGHSVLAMAVLWEGFKIYRSFKTGVPSKYDHSAHLSGYATGIASAEYVRRSMQARRRAEEKKKSGLGKPTTWI